MAQKAFFGLFSAVARAGEAALVSVMMLLAGAGCVEPNPPPAGHAGGPGLCSLIALDSCEAGGAAGHEPADAGIGGESGSAGAGGSDPAGAGGSPAGTGGAGGSGDCVDGHGSTGPDGKECPSHAGNGGGAGTSGQSGAGGASGDGGKAGAGGASGAGQGGDGGSDPGGASGSGQSGDGGQAGDGPAGAGGTSGNGGDAGAGGSGQGGSSAGASGASASGAGGAGGSGQGGAGAGGGSSGSGGSKAGAGGASGAGQSGAGQGGAGAGAGGSDPAGAGGSAGQAQLKPWGCKDFVVDSSFEDQQSEEGGQYIRINAVGPYVFGGSSKGVDVLTKKDGAWTKIHVPGSGDGVEWAAGPDKDGNYWFAATGVTGSSGLFKGQGQSWNLVVDAPPAYGFSRMVFTPDGTLYALGGDGQARLWKRTPSGQWKDLIGNHPMKDMGVEGLAYVGGVIYASAYEIDQSGTQFLAAHIYGYEGGKWVEIPGIAAKASRLAGLEPSGDHGLVASGLLADAALQGGYRSVALFVDLPSKVVTVAKEAAGFGYGRTLYSPRFGSYISATQLVYGEEAGVATVYDGFGLSTLKPFAYTTNSVGIFPSPSSTSAVVIQPASSGAKALYATATCGDL